MNFDIGAEVRFTYASLGLLNKIRAWSRKNNATVHSSRYAKDAFEGTVRIFWLAVTDRNSTRPEVRAKALRNLIGTEKPRALN
jgi:hypothetical protein